MQITNSSVRRVGLAQQSFNHAAGECALHSRDRLKRKSWPHRYCVGVDSRSHRNEQYTAINSEVSPLRHQNRGRTIAFGARAVLSILAQELSPVAVFGREYFARLMKRVFSTVSILGLDGARGAGE